MMVPQLCSMPVLMLRGLTHAHVRNGTSCAQRSQPLACTIRLNAPRNTLEPNKTQRLYGQECRIFCRGGV